MTTTKKTGTEILGTRLLANPHATHRMLRRLPKDVAAFINDARHDLPGIDAGELHTMTHEAFAVQPLVIGELHATRVEAVRRDFLNEYRCWMSGHLHEAEVPYAGDPVFWKQQPSTSTAFPFLGIARRNMLRLRTFIDHEDYYGFREDVQTALRHAREHLAMTENAQRLLAEQAKAVVERVLVEATDIRS